MKYSTLLLLAIFAYLVFLPSCAKDSDPMVEAEPLKISLEVLTEKIQTYCEVDFVTGASKQAEMQIDFGDGNFSQNGETTHMYKLPGKYEAVLEGKSENELVTQKISINVEEKIQAGATMLPNGKIYFFDFAGGSYFRHDWASQSIDNEYPRPLDYFNADFPTVESIDAAFTGPNEKTYFFDFDNDRYWRYDFDAARFDEGYPYTISSVWKGIPDNWENIDGVTYSPTGKVFFFNFSIGEYLRYNFDAGAVDAGYPAPISRISNWPSEWDNVDAIVTGPNNRSYFFDFERGEYLRLNWETSLIDDGYPGPISNFSTTLTLSDFTNCN